MHSKTSIRRVSVWLTCVLIAGTGTAPAQERTPEKQEQPLPAQDSLAPLSAPIQNSTSSDTKESALDRIKELASGAKKLAGWYSDAKSVYDASKALAELLGIIETFDEQHELVMLHAELNALSLQFSYSNQSERLSKLTGAINIIDAERLLAEQQKRPFQPFSREWSGNEDTAGAVEWAENPDQWQRAYVESLTNLPWPIKTRPEHTADLVYDWRLAVAPLMQLIGLRLQVIPAVDPQFRQHPEIYTRELGDMRNALLTNYQLMTDSVACDYALGGKPWFVIVACADLYTGNQRITSFQATTPIQQSEQIEQIEDGFRREILSEMPLFEMRAMIDDLYLYLHPRPDLADSKTTDNVIQPVYNKSLCLEMEAAAFDRGATSATLSLQSCGGGNSDNWYHGNPQLWFYDRPTSTIKTLLFSVCLAAASPSRDKGVYVIATACDGSPQQRWTYDLQTGIIQNGMGTVLDVQGGHLQAGARVWLWDRNGTAAQQFGPCRPGFPGYAACLF